jgi:hypothetical protein
MDNSEKAIDLGYVNDWNETPALFMDCQIAEHRLLGQNVGKCLTKISCSICNYFYHLDSSD